MPNIEYTIRRKVFTFLTSKFHIHDAQGKLLGFSEQKAFKLKEDIRIYADEAKTDERVMIKARQIIDFGASYDVIDAQTKEKVGALKRKGLASIVRDSWVVMDAEDQEIGKIQEDSVSMALIRRFIPFGNWIPQSYHLSEEGEEPIAEFRQHFNPFVQRLTVTVYEGCPVSKLLVLAAGVLLVAIEGRPTVTDELPAIPGGWTTRDFPLAGTTLRITLPAQPDAFLDDPDVLAANRRDDYMPYWSYLWPTSLETAVAVLKHDWPPGIAALEIGAGIALTGQAALTRGLNVSFSDYDQQAIDLALFNARQNVTQHLAEGLLLDWREPIDRQFPVIFGCDVIYEKQNHRPILGLLEKMLARDGQAWISDPGRHQADAFLELLAHSPFQSQQRTLVREPYPGRPAGTTNLWILTWK